MDLKVKAGLIVALVLCAALIGGAGRSLVMDPDERVSITLGPELVRAGELATFKVTTTGEGGVVTFPGNILVVKQGQVTDTYQQPFSGSVCQVTVLLPHSMPAFEVEVASEGLRRTFPVRVEPSPAPLLSGQSYYDTEVQLVDGYPGRVTGSDSFQSAVLDYRSRLQDLGFETELQKFTRSDETRTYEVWNLIGYHQGELYPDEWIVMGAHLDIVDQTYQGAYDNGAGASAILELAQALAPLKTRHTLVLALWGGEEQGLWGSEHFVDVLPPEVAVKAYLNFDMPGINWPGRDPFHGYVGPDDDDQRTEHPELLALLDRSAFELLAYPHEAFISKEQEVGSSDHDSFMARGIPSVFFFGMTFESWTTNYHNPTDTVEGMELHAGGHDELVGGFNTVAWVGFYTCVLLDNDEKI